MPLRLEIKRKLVQRSDRVKSVELHPTEPWVLSNLYSGVVTIWNHATNAQVKSFEVTEMPVRTARFVSRKQWVVTGADDMFVRAYNYNTGELVKAFEAHSDYVRCLAVHPTLPLLLSCSDDMLIKLWDWDKGWACAAVFEGHSHYVMAVAFNPKDTNTFVSASLDRTVKVWSLGQAVPNFTLEGHEKGVNCVDYFPGGERPYLVSGADDKTVKVWDYQTKSCVQTLEGHAHNVSAVAFHPELPLLITGSEDGALKLWHATTYRLENTLQYGMDRAWALAVLKGSNDVAVGYDEGTLMFKIGREEPVASMDSSGKIVWARHNEIQTVNVRSVPPDHEIVDGERLPLAVKDLGSCELYPQSLSHNPNGRFVAVAGDGEYIVYTALAWRNKTFGTALELAWGPEASEYAVRESPSRILFFKNFAEKRAFTPAFAAEGLHGGALLGVRCADFVVFYDWADGRVVQRVDVAAKHVFWSDSGDLCAIASDTSLFVLRLDRAALADGLAQPPPPGSPDGDGIDGAFELLHEVPDCVRAGLWVGDCFVYTTSEWRLCYCVGGEVTTLFHLDRPLYLLGYMASQSRLYLLDRHCGVVPFTLSLAVIEYKTLVLRGDSDAAAALLPSLPPAELDGVARFLESRGDAAGALAVATDPEYRFDLALALGRLPEALATARALGSEPKWRALGEAALAAGDFPLADTCLWAASDLAGLLLLYSSTGDAAGLARLAGAARARGRHNVGFAARMLLGQPGAAVALLTHAGRLAEAAFCARTYAPSRVGAAVAAWKADLATVNRKAADALADPAAFPNLFRDWEAALGAEAAALGGGGAAGGGGAGGDADPPAPAGLLPASAYPQHAGDTRVDAVAAYKAALLAPPQPPPPQAGEAGEAGAEAEEGEPGRQQDEEPAENGAAPHGGGGGGGGDDEPAGGGGFAAGGADEAAAEGAAAAVEEEAGAEAAAAEQSAEGGAPPAGAAAAREAAAEEEEEATEDAAGAAEGGAPAGDDDEVDERWGEA